MIATSVLDQLVTRASDEKISHLVVGAIVRVDDSVLLLQRRYHGLNAGVMELPTTAVGATESLPAAVSRAVREKTGLAVTDVGDHIGSFDYLGARGKVSRQLNFAVSVAVPGPVVLPLHHAYRWYSIDGEMPVTRSVQEVFRNYRRQS